jgi:tetratricopeptide (TPR) repeat protein
LIKEGKFEEAIACFEKSYHFFSRNSWIDKYRYVTLFSASKMSYKEMALCNIAFCYSQVNEGLKAIEYYERTLQEFPENGLAKTGLKMLNSVQQIEKKEE